MGISHWPVAAASIGLRNGVDTFPHTHPQTNLAHTSTKRFAISSNSDPATSGRLSLYSCFSVPVCHLCANGKSAKSSAAPEPIYAYFQVCTHVSYECVQLGTGTGSRSSNRTETPKLTTALSSSSASSSGEFIFKSYVQFQQLHHHHGNR